MTLSAPARATKPVRARRRRAKVAGAEGRPSARLLAWYDENRRDLPWRAPPGERSDPYRVWLSEIMLQQTTVAAVIPYYARFLARFPTVHDLAAAELDHVLPLWAGLGYYARARNLHACARMVIDRHAGVFPHEVAELRALPGIGEYTAAAISAIAFDECAVPVDGNVERVVARLFAIADALPRGKAVIRQAAERLAPARRTGDFAQALMDLGATLCTPRRPDCARCPLRADCAAHARGDPESFPVKDARRQRRLRRGAAFVVLRADGCLLLRTRSARGLLGGMTEVPTTEWTDHFDEANALAHAPMLLRAHPPPRRAGEDEGGERKLAWRRAPGVVSHVFTHFPLELVAFVAHAPAGTEAPAGMRWVPFDRLDGEALPNLMRKVIAHARLVPERKTKASQAERAAVTPAPPAPARAKRRSR